MAPHSMRLLQMGVSHEEAPLPALEQALRAAAALRLRIVEAVRTGEVVRESVVVATCHRLEVYAAGHDPAPLEETLRTAFSQSGMLDHAPLAVRRDRDAARHLCEVATGLRSLIVGEREVLDQVRGAWKHAVADGTAGPLLAALFRQARRAGQLARSPAALGAPGLSLATIGVHAAREALGTLRGRHGVVAGAGPMGRQVREQLQEEGVASLAIATRRPDRLRERRPDLVVHSLADLPSLLAEADFVIAATAAPAPILLRSQLPAARRASTPLLLIDLGVPRNLDPALATAPRVRLLHLDDLRPLVAALQQVDADALAHATRLADEATERFRQWQAARGAAGNGRVRPVPAVEPPRRDPR